MLRIFKDNRKEPSSQEENQIANDNKSKSKFMANISHEFRTPLNGIIGMAELLNTTNMDYKQKKYVNIIHSSGLLLLNLINDLLDFSKIEADELKLKAEPVDLNILFTEVIQALIGRAQENSVELSFHCPEDIPLAIYTDAIRLKQILVSLVSNAIKHTHHGSVAINISKIKQTGSDIKLRFEISDTGTGLSKSKMSKIFEKFIQIDPATTWYMGTSGISLAICKRLIEIMGGKIGVLSTPNAGSTFWIEITFPLQLEEKKGDDLALENIALRKRNVTSFPQFNACVLVAEDSKSNQDVAKQMLASFGCTAYFAYDGKKCIEMLEKEPDKYDIVFMDCQMPNMDGFDTTSEIRNQPWGKNIKICAITADALPGYKEKCIAAGMDDYISKPVRIADFERVLTKFLGKPGEAKAY